MPETMIERVARAIYDEWSLALAEQWEAPLISYDSEIPHPERDAARRAARAAIAAMREPTEAMTKAATYAVDRVDAMQGMYGAGEAAWQAAIYAALNELPHIAVTAGVREG